MRPAVTWLPIGLDRPIEAPKHLRTSSLLISVNSQQAQEEKIIDQQTKGENVKIDIDIKICHSTRLRHRCFVDNYDVFQGPSHSSFSDIMSAKSVEEAGVHPKVILLWEFHD